MQAIYPVTQGVSNTSYRILQLDFCTLLLLRRFKEEVSTLCAHLALEHVHTQTPFPVVFWKWLLDLYGTMVVCLLDSGEPEVAPLSFLCILKPCQKAARGLGCPHKGPSWRLSLLVFSVAAERQNFSSVLEVKQVWGSNHLSRHVSWDFQCSDAHLKSLHLWARFPPVFHWQSSFPLIITCELPRRLPLVKKHLLKFQKQLCMFSITVSVCCWLSGCALFPVHMHRYGGFILDFLILWD